MVWLFILFFFLTPQPVAAQEIPLFYQLMQAYRPLIISYTQAAPISLNPDNTAAAAGQVLGVATNAPPTSIASTLPVNVGGEGKIITVAVIGDSMIETLGKDIPYLQKALSQYYPHYKFRILNYGLGSSNLESGIRRLNESFTNNYGQMPDLISQKPDLVIIESFAYNNYGNSQSGYDKQWLNLGAITTQIRQKLPQTKIVLAATIAPNSVTFANGVKDLHYSAVEKIEKTSTIKLYLQNLVNFATSQNFPLADAYHQSLTGKEGRPELISNIDYIHPSELGSQFFCDIVAKTVKDSSLLP